MKIANNQFLMKRGNLFMLENLIAMMKSCLFSSDFFIWLLFTMLNRCDIILIIEGGMKNGKYIMCRAWQCS